MKTALTLVLLITTLSSFAQIDTVNTKTGKLNTSLLKDGKATYAVYFEDSLGHRLGSAALWDRTMKLSKDKSSYTFLWDWWQKDSLMAHVEVTGDVGTLKPRTHFANYRKRGRFSFQFKDNLVTVPDSAKRTKKDSLFNVTLTNPAFEFPMDLETFPLLPFKKVGQQFAIAFYEPGTPKSNYYKLTVTGKEDLVLNGATKVNCWLLRIDYSPASSATFWISDKSREVVKMKDSFKGRNRYKVRLY